DYCSGFPVSLRMRHFCQLVLSAAIALCSLHVLSAQDLRPRAYVVTPVHWNAVIVGYAFNDGSIFFGTVLPITNASGRYSVPNLSYYHSLSFFKRSANFTATLPYVVGTFQGEVQGNEQSIYRSGLADSIFRFSVNLLGGPAMLPKDFVKWRQKTILGASIQVVAPTGQYYPSHLINPGSNRWGFKPELGYSGRRGNWILDAYGGVWLFTANNNYLTGSEFSKRQNTLTEAPVGALEMHLSYDVKPRLWASVDGNYWYGGKTTVNDAIKTGTLQANSRIGGTLSVPFTKHQSVKFSYSDGELARIGGTFQTVSFAWQYSWLGRPQ
ncbi:MAG: transporter, partial [Alloacidobacterium sp.]